MRQSCSGDALWPSTIPYQHTPHTALPNRDWRLGISRRLCQIIHHNHEDLICPACKTRLPDGYGDHLLYCQRTSSGTRTSLWHNGVERELSHCLRAAGWAHQRQPKDMIQQLADEDTGLVPDVVVFERGQQQGKLFLDVRTVIPTMPSYLRSGLPQPGAAAEAEARKKIDKYSQRCQVQGDSFAPIVIEDGGRLGPHLNDLLFQISRSLTEDGGGKGFNVYWRQRLAARNLRGVSACIFQQLPDPPNSLSDATGFQLTRQSPPQHRFADPPPRLTSSLSRRLDLSVSLPCWVVGLRDKHVSDTCTGPRFSSMFPHFSGASATPTTPAAPPPTAPSTPDLSIVPSASSPTLSSYDPNAELGHPSAPQHLMPSPLPTSAILPPVLSDSPPPQHPPSPATSLGPHHTQNVLPPPPSCLLANAPLSPPGALAPILSAPLAHSLPSSSYSSPAYPPPACDSGPS